MAGNWLVRFSVRSTLARTRFTASHTQVNNGGRLPAPLSESGLNPRGSSELQRLHPLLYSLIRETFRLEKSGFVTNAERNLFPGELFNRTDVHDGERDPYAR